MSSQYQRHCHHHHHHRCRHTCFLALHEQNVFHAVQNIKKQRKQQRAYNAYPFFFPT